MSSKAKCNYWEKCFRKDTTHLAEFLHPGDMKENKKETKREEKEEAVIKPSLRRGKTHELSFVDETPSVEVKKKREEKKEEPEEMDTSEAKPATRGKERREKCKYWAKCYRKDAGHKKLYVHPGDPDEKQAVEPGKTRASNRPKPLHRMDSVDSVVYGGFTLKRAGSNYACTCSSFSGAKNFGKASNQKTCTHLKQYLGEEFEIARCNLPEKGKKERIPQHINISVLLAHKYQDGVTNPTGWWMSEKLDGVRAYWNGKCFYSRLGNAFFAPSWFTQDLPRHMHLDGELFGGRKKFQSTVSIVKTPEHALWNKVSYNVFDAPHLEKEPFEKRMKAVKEYFEKAKPKYAKIVEHEKCTGTDQVDKELKRIIALGGEGLMIRQPGSKYERTRSKTLLKIKKFHDAEAVVVGYEPSKSNHSLTGALWVKMACGKQFKVGSGLSNKDRRNPPKKGTIITYKFQEYTNSGTPRFPSYVGIRIDLKEPKDAEGVVTTAVDDP